MKRELPLYKQIEKDIIKQINLGLLKNGDRILSEKEITEKYHVSQITAKNALNILSEKGYVNRVQGKGTFVSAERKTQNKRLIGVIFTTLSTEIDKSLLDAIENYSKDFGFQILFGLSRENLIEENRLIEDFINRGVDGLIIFPTETEIYNEFILELYLKKFPIVLIDRYFKKFQIPYVVSNNYKGGYDAADYLLKRDMENISFINTAESNSATIDRIRGIEAAFIDNKIPINKNLWISISSKEKNIKKAITDHLELFKDINAIITVNARLADFIANFALENNVFLISFDKPSVFCNYNVLQKTKQISLGALTMLSKLISEKTLEHTEVEIAMSFLPYYK